MSRAEAIVRRKDPVVAALKDQQEKIRQQQKQQPGQADQETPGQTAVDQAYQDLEDGFWVWDMRALVAADTARDYQMLRASSFEVVAKWFLKKTVL